MTFFNFFFFFFLFVYLFPKETICTKSQSLFSGEKKNKKNIINLPSVEFAHTVVKVKRLHCIFSVSIFLG